MKNRLERRVRRPTRIPGWVKGATFSFALALVGPHNAWAHRKRADPCGCHHQFGLRHCHAQLKTNHCEAPVSGKAPAAPAKEQTPEHAPPASEPPRSESPAPATSPPPQSL